MGHLDAYENSLSDEGKAFIDLLVGFVPDEIGRMIVLYMINDGQDRFAKLASNPKDRWLRLLEAVERRETSELKAA
jgi:hypothetical protein